MTAGRIFLSYRRADTRHMAGRLFDRLCDEYGEDAIFMDVDSIEPGLDYTEVVNRAIGNCDALIALIGREWLGEADKWGRVRLADPTDLMSLEIKAALDRGIRVIPVLVDGAAMPRREELPLSIASLARRHSIRIDHETFRQDVKPLINALGQEMTKASAEFPRDDREDPSDSPAQRISAKNSEGDHTGISRQIETPERPVSKLDYWGISLFILGAPVIVVGFVTQISALGLIGLAFLTIGAITLIASVVAKRL